MEDNRTERTIILNVNGKDYKIHDVREADTLADVLRDRLGLLGTKVSCNEGSCGACTVLVDGQVTLSCMTLAVLMEGKKILTIEGLSDGKGMDVIQEAFLEERGYACGYCTPGIIMTAKAFLDENPSPTRQEIKEAISGNICRCGVYEHVENAIELAAEKMKEGRSV